MIPVYLDPNEQIWALDIAHQRFKAVDGKGKPAFPGATEKHHQIGAGAELAFAKLVEVEWPASVNTFTSEPDVPPRWEVRWTKLRGVKVRAKDAEDALCVWISGKFPRFEVMGYIRAGGAKRHPEWYDDPGKRGQSIWLVPPSRMIPIEPGFHRMCLVEQDDWGLWRCAFCGRRGDAAYQRA